MQTKFINTISGSLSGIQMWQHNGRSQTVKRRGLYKLTMGLSQFNPLSTTEYFLKCTQSFQSTSLQSPFLKSYNTMG